MIENFERFLIERFLEFFNNKEGSSFKYIEKRDERVRNERSYDYLCRDMKTKEEMGIEAKRLISKELEYKAQLKNYFERYTLKGLDKPVTGTFILALDYFQIMQLRQDKRKLFFEHIKDKVSKKMTDYSPDDISENPKASLLKISDEGTDISLFLNNFSSADEERIKFLVKKAKEKFSATKGTMMMRIILLLERSLSCRREEIRSIIESMIFEGTDLDEIDAIYHLAIWRKPCIARVYPEGKIFESKFFAPEKYFLSSEFLQSCSSYFR